MPLIKVRNNVIVRSDTGGVERINIDGLRVDGGPTVFADEKGGGTFPATAVFPVSVIVSGGGDIQTLTDDGATVFVRNYGLTGWGAWV